MVHLGDGVQQLLGVAQALLEQVRQAVRSVPEQLQRVLRVVVLRQDDDAELGILGAQLEGEVDALAGERRGHADVQQHDVRGVGHPQLAQLVGIRCRAAHGQATDLFEDDAGALPHEVVVVAHERPDRVQRGTEWGLEVCHEVPRIVRAAGQPAVVSRWRRRSASACARASASSGVGALPPRWAGTHHGSSPAAGACG